MSVNSTNPGKLFGGKWEQITGRFLYCTTTSKILGGDTTTGSHTLTINEMPSHNHAIPNQNNGGYSGWKPTGADKGWVATPPAAYVGNTGGGQGHTHPQNLPPYFTVYCWYRVS